MASAPCCREFDEMNFTDAIGHAQCRRAGQSSITRPRVRITARRDQDAPFARGPTQGATDFLKSRRWTSKSGGVGWCTLVRKGGQSGAVNP